MTSPKFMTVMCDDTEKTMSILCSVKRTVAAVSRFILLNQLDGAGRFRGRHSTGRLVKEYQVRPSPQHDAQFEPFHVPGGETPASSSGFAQAYPPEQARRGFFSGRARLPASEN